MQSFHKIVITVAFSVTCFSVPVLGAAAAGSVRSSAKSAEVKLPEVVAGTGAAEEPGTSLGVGVERGVELPGRPDWVGSLADQVKALKAQFQKENQDLLKAYKEMLRQAKEVGKEERDKVREQFKVQREELLARQKELREEYKRRFEEFRADHPEHLDVIDAAKERAKEAVRERRGHGGE